MQIYKHAVFVHILTWLPHCNICTWLPHCNICTWLPHCNVCTWLPHCNVCTWLPYFTTQYLKTDYSAVCDVLEPIISAKAKVTSSYMVMCSDTLTFPFSLPSFPSLIPLGRDSPNTCKNTPGSWQSSRISL